MVMIMSLRAERQPPPGARFERGRFGRYDAAAVDAAVGDLEATIEALRVRLRAEMVARDAFERMLSTAHEIALGVVSDARRQADRLVVEAERNAAVLAGGADHSAGAKVGASP